MPANADLVERFRTAVDLWATGVALKRQTLCRTHPDLPTSEIDRLVAAWLQERPGAEMGDGPQPEPA